MSRKLEELFLKLNLDSENGLYQIDANWKSEISFPSRVKRLLEKRIKPDAFFCFDNKPLVLFFENPINKQELHEAIWNFNECPIVVIIENDLVEIFNGFKYERHTQSLQKLGGSDRLNDFSYFELVTGRTWEQYKEHLDYKNRVDYHLLQNIRAARAILLDQNEKRAKLVNSVIGKAIFVRYLIDRKVKMKFDGRLRTWTNEEFCELLDHPNQVQEFFEYLEDSERGFNGDLFPISPGEYRLIRKNDYQVLKRLLLGDEIATNQPSLFQLYDFSIIPIEFISNVYELFIGQDNQQKEGAYYTPLFLVDHILKETVERHLSATNSFDTVFRDEALSEPYSYCKVLDPACGSGVFLVETLRKIIEKYIADTDIDIKSQKFKTVIKNLAKENIYGVDKDQSAVQVAIFSIYLTLLDYLEPPGIETFKFPVLLNSNFFHSDFFDSGAEFNNYFKDVKFNFILGNPPWKGNGMDEVGNRYITERRSREQACKKKFSIAINNNEIAEGFVLRAGDFCKEHTKIALIIRSSSLYNLGYSGVNFSPFRQYLLEEYFIDSVLELAPVRYEVFDRSNTPAVAPAAVIFYRYANGKSTDKNIVHHTSLKYSRFFSLFKIFTLNRNDRKKVLQSKLKEFDWLWKVLVYGSYLDFNFIKRLNEEYESIQKVIDDEHKFVVGTGIQYSSSPSYNSKHLVGKPFVDSKGVSSFFVQPDKISKFDKPKVHRLRDERLFEAPMLLIREGTNMETLTARCAFSDKDLLFKDSITSIKPLSKSDIKAVNNIAAVLSSSLFSYYSICTFASIGIERERIKNYNKFSLPYVELNVNENIKRMEKIGRDIYLESRNTLINDHKLNGLKNSFKSEIEKIDDLVSEKLEIDDIEKSLIQYSQDVNLNMIVGDDASREKLFDFVPSNDSTLTNYASVFTSRFKTKLETENNNKFVVEIWYSEQVIGMFFKLVSPSEYISDVIILSKQNKGSEILSFLAKVSSEKITDKLFVQKDVRGFEKDSFYIFKPNEKRLWHKAVAYIDSNEFADAILKVEVEKA